MNRLSDGFSEIWENVLAILPSATVGLVLFLALLFLGKLVRNFTVKRLSLRISDQLLSNFIGRVVFLTFFIVGLIIFLTQLGLGRAASSVLAGAGVSAIILGFAFKDIGENFLAGFFLAFNRPFSIGDIVEVVDKTGTVKALTFRNTHIRTFDGRDVFLPNALVIKNPLTNYTKDGLIRHDFVIGIDYGDDTAEATRVIVDELSSMNNIVHTPPLAPFVIINEFATSTVNLKIHFWINTFDFLGAITTLKSAVMQKVLIKLSEEGFTMPADIIELKRYNTDQAFPVAIDKNL